MKRFINDVRYFIITRLFVLTLFLSLTLSIFFLYIPKSDNTNLLRNYLMNSSNVVFSFLMLVMCLIISNKIFNEVKNNVNYLVRFSDRVSAYRYSLKMIIFINTMIMLICYVIPFVLLVIDGKLAFILGEYYEGINYLVYLIFYVIRNVFVINVLMLIYFAFRLLFNSKIALGLYLCNIVSLVLLPINSDLINNLSQFKLLPKYYLYPIRYSSFLFEVSTSILYVSILFTIYFVILNIYSKKNSDII